MNPKDRHPTQGTQGVRRVSAVLDVVAEHGESGCRLADVTRQTGLGRATAHRFLKALQDVGLVDHDPLTQNYFPGLRLLSLAEAASGRFGIVRRVAPSLKRLANRSEDTVYLSIRLGDEAVCVAREEGVFPIKTLTLEPGDRRPLGVGAGSLALLAFMDDREIDRILREYAPRLAEFAFSTSLVRTLVEDARRDGYALNDGGRIIPGMTAIGVPICEASGRPIAALSVAAITERLAGRRREDMAALLRKEAQWAEIELSR